jgi:hypothetical protein
VVRVNVLTESYRSGCLSPYCVHFRAIVPSEEFGIWIYYTCIGRPRVLFKDESCGGEKYSRAGPAGELK